MQNFFKFGAKDDQNMNRIQEIRKFLNLERVRQKNVLESRLLPLYS